MKKAFLILILSSFIGASACNSRGNGNENDRDPATGTDIQKETSMGNVAQMTTAQFRQFVFDYQANPDNWVFKGDIPVVIDFYADWCRPCKMVAPIMEDLAKQYKGRIRFYKINTDQERELSALFKINSIPAILFIPKGDKPQISVGALPKTSYEQAINEILKIK